MIRESVGEVADFDHGPDGRITTRNGSIFAYDAVGRRTEDDRFLYLWNWRGQLHTLTVKDTWPDDEITPFAGHQLLYDYDAVGRLTFRTHRGELPEGETDDSLRPFLGKRTYVWEDQSLLAEIESGDPAATEIRWRKTYIPGAYGLDDAMQVAVEVLNVPVGAVQGNHLYTYLRDELGTVIAIVAEDEGTDATNPPVPVRYLYTPFGQVHAEVGPELRRVRFRSALTQVETSTAGLVDQTIADSGTHAPGALRILWTLPLDEASLASGLVVERSDAPGHWVALPVADLALGRPPLLPGETSSGRNPAELLVMLRNGWTRGTSYRVRLLTDLQDQTGRSFASEETLEWSFPDSQSTSTHLEPLFSRQFPLRFESYEAASDTVGGRFPGGQSCLWQGAWVDPVSGLSYHRARWYDPRNASWLSEDPMLDVDSPNLYAPFGWQPHMGKDPLGLACQGCTPKELTPEQEAQLQQQLEYLRRAVRGADKDSSISPTS